MLACIVQGINFTGARCGKATRAGERLARGCRIQFLSFQARYKHVFRSLACSRGIYSLRYPWAFAGLPLEIPYTWLLTSGRSGMNCRICRTVENTRSSGMPQYSVALFVLLYVQFCFRPRSKATIRQERLRLAVVYWMRTGYEGLSSILRLNKPDTFFNSKWIDLAVQSASFFLSSPLSSIKTCMLQSFFPIVAPWRVVSC